MIIRLYLKQSIIVLIILICDQDFMLFIAPSYLSELLSQ